VKPKFHGFVFEYCGNATPNPGGGERRKAPVRGILVKVLLWSLVCNRSVYWVLR